jgi:hypothetical protein
MSSKETTPGQHPFEEWLNNAKRDLDAGRVISVWDIDSTLLDVTPRHISIFNQLKGESWVSSELNGALEKIRFEPKDFGYTEAFENAGFDLKQNEEVWKRVHEYWVKEFFSDRHCSEDVEIAGASRFLNEVYESGIEVIYLTGRWKSTMFDATVDSLEKFNFPLKDKSRLFLKPDSKLKDAPFKIEVLKSLLAAYSESAKFWFIDNEPVNTNAAIKQLPEAKVVFFDWAHSKREEPLRAHLHVSSFPG